MAELDIAQETADVANQVFESQEFKHYQAYRDVIVSRLLADHLDAIRTHTAADRSAVEESRRRFARFRTRFIATAFVPICAIVALAAIGVFRNPAEMGYWNNLLGVLAVCFMGGYMFWGPLAKPEGAPSVRIATGALDRSMIAAVKSAISTSINTELGSTGVVAFPAYAPRLVELDVAQIRQSTTTSYIKAFILEHESSAIGLAGTRGSGKSTVMRALKVDPDVDGPVVIVPSPVRYDPGEFIRLLLTQIAKAVVGTPDRRLVARIGNSIDRIDGRLLTIAMLVGVGMLALPLTAKAISVPPIFDSTLARIVALSIVAVAGVAQAVKVTLRARAGSSLDVRRARELLREVKWETEHGTTAKTTVKVNSLAEMGGERSLKLKSRSMGHAELVTALRELLELFANREDRARMVVCVDELDKISDPDQLIVIVNELKDLFHTQKVHFLVTVSTDALDSFERRGLAGRDAFDSAFDAVVHTRWLTLDESVEVVSARAPGFPPMVAMFCHAWSGGLPRDLLRAARTAVELQRRDTEKPLSIETIVAELVFEDLGGAARAMMRGLAADDKQVDGLWTLQQALEAALPGERATTCGLQETVDTLSFDDPILQALHAKVRLGLSLLRIAQAATSMPNYWVEDGTAIRNLRRTATRHADAMRQLGEPAPVREDAVRKATGQFDPAVLVPPPDTGPSGKPAH